jgi:hypothetical protein
MRGYWAWRHSNDFDVTNHLSKTTRSDAGRPSLVAKTALTHQNVVCEITNPVLVALDTKELKRRCYNCYSYSEEIADLAYDESESQSGRPDKLQPCEQCEIVYWCSQVGF